jgi:hypothetical protein
MKLLEIYNSILENRQSRLQSDMAPGKGGVMIRIGRDIFIPLPIFETKN